MTFDQKIFSLIWFVLLAVSPSHAEQNIKDALVRTEGIYRSQVQTNENETDYISVLRFATDGRIFLTHVSMPARQERLCEWFKPELKSPYWSSGSSYKIDGNRLTFQTTSSNAITVFDGTIDAGLLQLQLLVPTRQNLTYSLTFQFAPCT